MPDVRYKWCKDCHRHTTEVGPLSWNRLCSTCGHARLRENAVGLHRHDGPAFERWRRSVAASVGAVFIDDAA